MSITRMRPRIFIPFYEYMKILLRAENETRFYIDNALKPRETFVKSFVNWSISRFVFRSYCRPVSSIFVYSYPPPPPARFGTLPFHVSTRNRWLEKFSTWTIEDREICFFKKHFGSCALQRNEFVTRSPQHGPSGGCI